MSEKISQFTAASSVALSDYIPCVIASGPTTQRATFTVVRAALLPIVLTADVSGVLPAANGGWSASASESLTNKTISGASNTLTVRLASDVSGTLPVANGGTGQTALLTAMGALDVDWSSAPTFTKTLAAGGNTITFSNKTAGLTIVVRLTSNGGGSTVTWPTVKWPSGSVPTQTSTGTDVYTFFYDGSSVYGSVVQDMS